MTELRKKLRTISSKNQGLQDILQTCKEAKEVISVEKTTGGMHNTKAIFLMLDGKTRVHFYNRVLITKVVPEGFISSGIPELDIDILNSVHGCDFTEDDIEFVCGGYNAKPGSLGYYSTTSGGSSGGSNLPANTIAFNIIPPGMARANWYTVRLRVEQSPGEWEVFEVRSDSQFRANLETVVSELNVILESPDFQPYVKATFNLFDWTFTPCVMGEIENISNKNIELTINLLDGNDDPVEVRMAMVILPNTKLQASGSKITYCPTTDIARLNKTDFVDFIKGMWNDDVQAPNNVMPFHGTHYGINNGLKNSFPDVDGLPWGEPEPSEWGPAVYPLNPYMEAFNNGLGSVLRTFVASEFLSEELHLNGGKYDNDNMVLEYGSNSQLIFKNMMPNPIELNHVFLNRPVQLAPSVEKTHPDEIFIFTGGLNPGDPRELDFKITIGALNVNITTTTWEKLYHRLSRMPGAENIDSIVDFTALTETLIGINFLHVKNLTVNDLPFRIEVHDPEMGDEIYEVLSDVILKPKGTEGVMIDDDLVEIDRFLRTQLQPEQEIYFRGKLIVKLPFAEMFNDEIDLILRRVGIVSFRKDGLVTPSFASQSPFYEELEVKKNGVTFKVALPTNLIGFTPIMGDGGDPVIPAT